METAQTLNIRVKSFICGEEICLGTRMTVPIVRAKVVNIAAEASNEINPTAKHPRKGSGAGLMTDARKAQFIGGMVANPKATGWHDNSA